MYDFIPKLQKGSKLDLLVMELVSSQKLLNIELSPLTVYKGYHEESRNKTFIESKKLLHRGCHEEFRNKHSAKK